MSDSCTETEAGVEPLLTLTQKYQCLVYYSNAFYHQTEYRKAVVGSFC